MKRINRLVISMPPRHGKSELASHWFPVWYLNQFPRNNIILASYGSDFAEQWGRRVRNTIEEHKGILNVELARDSLSAAKWNTTLGGGMQSVGVGGPTTGRGANILIIDDPIKNSEEANSLVRRESIDDWWRSTAYTRLEPHGGVIIIMCMTGDTPVLMADGSSRPLSSIRPGDHIATYENGKVTTSTVKNWANQGPDRIFAIRTESGTIVRANARHPFLVDVNGKPKWKRTADLCPGDRIFRVSGVSGAESHAPQTTVADRQFVKGYANLTTTNNAGQAGSGHRRIIRRRAARLASAIGTASDRLTMMPSLIAKVASALSVNFRLQKRIPALTGAGNSALTMTMQPGRFADCSATIATSLLATGRPTKSSPQPLSTCEITKDTVIEVVEAGIEDVFDIQVERTENFIANGLVSHNTRWNEDDLVGRRLQQAADRWRVIEMPAICMEDGDPLGRKVGEALWPERYPVEALKVIEEEVGNYWFSAMYQQRPVPRDGGYFNREWFTQLEEPPRGKIKWVRFWDLAGTDSTVRADADYSVGILVGYNKDLDEFYISDIKRLRKSPGEVEREIKNTALEDGFMTTIWIEQEPGSSGKYVISQFKRLLPDNRVRGFVSTGPKESYADVASTRAERRKVKIVGSARWSAAFLSELEQYPKGAHDDQVDAFSKAIAVLIRRPQWGVVGGKEAA